MNLVKAVASKSRYGCLLILLPRPAKEASKQVGHEISEASISTMQSILRVYPQNTSALEPAIWASSRSRQFPGWCGTRKSGEPADSLVLTLLEAR